MLCSMRRFKNKYLGRLGTQLEVGPRTLFPAAFSMASVFSAYHNLPPHPAFQSYVRAFSPDAPTMPVDTFYWLAPQPWFQAKAEISHILVFYGDVRRHQALFYLELFNLPGVAVTMPYDGTNDTCKSYAVDVLQGKELTLKVDMAELQDHEWKPTHVLGDAALFKEMEQRIGRLLSIRDKRDDRSEIERIVRGALGPADGRAITQEDIARLSRRVAEFFVHRLSGGR